MTRSASTTIDVSATETTPLLSDRPAPPPAPIPRYQLLILCWARITQYWTYYNSFPYMPEFVRSTGVPEAQIGYNAGLVDSSLAEVQFFALIFWSTQGERFGRKPVLCCCLAGLSSSALLFGFSSKVWHMLVFRALAGAFSAGSL